MAVDVSKHLDRAKRYLEKNKVQDAIEAYLAVLEDAPSHQEATQALGDLYARLDKPDRAAVFYGVLFDLLTDTRDEPKALAIYTRFLKPTEQQPPERIARYAMLLQKQNRVEDAIEQFTLAAEIFQERGREEEALTCLERSAQLNPDDLTRHLKLGETAERIGKASIAARAYLRSGQLATAGGNHPEAVGLFERAYGLAPQERSVALLYAESKLRSGDAVAAAQLLEPFSIVETDSTFLETFGHALMRSGDLDRASAILDRVQSEKASTYDKYFDLADRFAKAKEDPKAIEILQKIKKRMFKAQRESEFAAQVDRLAEANSSSVLIGEFWGALYNELNRESKYFDVLVRLFDTYLEAGEVRKACDTLEKLVDIDAYDFRNQQRMERLRGKAPEAALQRIASRLAKSASMAMPSGAADRGLGESALGESSKIPLANVEGRGQQALEDLLVQTEIFLQYSLQGKAVERLQKIAELFPGEEEKNARLYNLYEMAHWWPPGALHKEDVPVVSAQPANIATKTGAYSADTLRDLSKISEISQTVYRQPTPRAMLNIAVNEVGTHLKVARCLAVIGAPGRPPEMAAEYCAPGVKPAPGAQIVFLLSQIERAVPDSLGGLALDAAAAPVLKEMGLETALGVALTDKETLAPAGMLVVAHAQAHKWKPNEAYFLQAVGDQMLLSVSHTRLRSLVRRMGVSDERTGLLGRSSYADCLLSETERAKTQGTPLAVTILQIDHGPELLRHQGETLVERHMEQLAKSLQPVVRQNDVAVKYTSWSLAFILPDTTLTGARNLADKLQKAAAAVRPPWEGTPPTISAGIAEAIARADFDNEDIVTDLINRAEASIEEARKKGGDTIVAAEVSTR
jgi:diguanylate cyclase (GGDEF)-like protein